MTKIQILTLLAAMIIVGTVSGCGCDAGAQPSGMSKTDAESAIAKMKPDDKIRAIASSPLPAAEKERRYADIEKETGVKAKDVLAGGPPTRTGTGN